MQFEGWDKAAKVTFDRRVLQELMSLRFVEALRNVVVLGPVGVGKTFIANALGHVACRSGFRVRACSEATPCSANSAKVDSITPESRS